MTHLDRAIDNLRKNPNDPQSLGKIKKLVAHYERYVKRAPTEELAKYQQKLFQPIGVGFAGIKANVKEGVLDIEAIGHLVPSAAEVLNVQAKFESKPKPG